MRQMFVSLKACERLNRMFPSSVAAAASAYRCRVRAIQRNTPHLLIILAHQTTQVSRDTDGDGQLSMAEMSAAGTLPSAQMQGAMMGGSYATGFTTVSTATRGSTSPIAAGSPILNYVQ